MQADAPHERMTIKWVKSDPLVMNGEPFCYGSRLTVRQLLQLRQNGYSVTEILKDHPELRTVGITFAYRFAAGDERYREFLAPDGSLAGPGFTDAEAYGLPDHLRIPGVVLRAGVATG